MDRKGNNHLWLMLLGCLLPIVALGAIFLFNVPISNVLLIGLFLLCPLLHLWMMRGGEHEHDHQETPSDVSATMTDEH